MKIGSLFSGYGGLDMGVQAVLGGEVAWHVEFDAAPSKILKYHWPDVPNYGDITQLDFATVEPVDILTGGFPCQDLSQAGRRAGMRPGTRSGLWSDYLRAIAALRPRMAVIENVRGLLSGCAESNMEPCPGCVGTSVKHRPPLRALGRVLGDLASIGYDAEWIGLRAADAGATHGRFRVVVAAHPAGEPWGIGNRNDVLARSTTYGHRPGTGRGSPTDSDGFRRERGERGLSAGSLAVAVDPLAHAASLGRGEGWPKSEGIERRPDVVGRSSAAWGDYAPAIHRWEQVIGRNAPAPTRPDGRNGGHRLSADFVEWMMGLPAGHVTSPDIGLSRIAQLKALGNGVVPQQVALALSLMTSIK